MGLSKLPRALILLSIFSLAYGLIALIFFAQRVEWATMYYPIPIFFATLALYAQAKATSDMWLSRGLMLVSVVTFIAAYAGLYFFRAIVLHPTVTEAWASALQFVSIVAPVATLIGIFAVLAKLLAL